CMQALEYPLTF
nr:immunoglobulin light chain junction region [Macaca mulatta]MOW40943.1 immunoglobulin light chain junction region [Macaca mulatta]MOW41048.1 immunoglobulin light chain junction region [Macaca mulatta]MOW41059.1 immunoglobulin light chain junction region [Macaca mulatta]MOW41216.1 immunoglobulin light chain junction region [Macaca mulatta]